MAALSAAGETIGLCDWRPDKGGEYGTFRVEALTKKEEVTRILKECSVPEHQYQIPPELLRAFNAVPDDKLSDPTRKVKSLIEHVNGQVGPKRRGGRGGNAPSQANA